VFGQTGDLRGTTPPCPPGTGTGNGAFAANIRIPVDDAHEWHFRLGHAVGRHLSSPEHLELNGYAYGKQKGSDLR
jgi:hypothetical protein